MIDDPDSRDAAIGRALQLDDRPGPARRLSGERVAAMVGAAMAQAELRPIAARRRWRVGLLAAALLVLASTAAAAVWSRVMSSRAVHRNASRAAAVRSSTPAAISARATHRGVAAAPMIASAVRPDPTAPMAAVVAPAPPASTTDSQEPPLAESTLRAPNGSRGGRAPDDLLRVANDLRRERRWVDAARAYQRVRTTYPGTDAAYAATIAGASLRLEHLADANSALRDFRSSLRAQPAGPLAEEARYGVAEAYRALGDDDAEAESLRAFVASHPDSPLSDRARARLHALDAPAQRDLRDGHSR